jgi:hypothetical protein
MDINIKLIIQIKGDINERIAKLIKIVFLELFLLKTGLFNLK